MRALALLALVTACNREWVRDYDGPVPGTWEQYSILLVRDKWTGEPIRGAMVRQHGEGWPGADGNWAPLIAEARTDRYGLAWIAVPEDPGSCHWAVFAKGYAPTEEYGNRVQTEVDLERGEEVAGRLLDPAGRPLPRVVVEYKVGCAHAPGLATARTDQGGLFVFSNVDPGGDFTFEDPRVRADYWSGARGTRKWGIRDYVTYAGAEVRGRVLWPDGTPAAGAVVHSHTSRGPRDVVEADGSFVLKGTTLDAHVTVYHAEGYYGFDLGRYKPGGPFVVVIGDEEGHVVGHTVLVDVPEAEGEFVVVHLDRVSDGRRFSEASLWTGRCRLENVPAGEYMLSAGDPSRRWCAGPRPLRVDGRTTLTLDVREQPALRIESDEEVTARVVMEDRDWRLEEHRSFLPPHAPAWLRIDHPGGTCVVPVGPMRDGARTARVPPLPGPKTLVFPGLEGEFTAWLLHARAEEVFLADPDARRLETYATGPHWMEVCHEEKGRALRRVVLPARADAPIVIDDLAFEPEGLLRVLDPEGRPVRGAWVEVEGAWAEATERRDGYVGPFRDGVRVRVATQGFTPVHARLAGDGPYEVRLGGATLICDLRHLEDASLVLDAEIHPGEERHVLRVPPGPHTLLVGAKGRKSRIHRIVLEPGETRRLKPDLPPR